MKKVIRTLLVILFLSFSIVLNVKVNASTTKPEIIETYYIGEKLVLPSYTFDDGTNATTYIKYPDGSYYRQNEITFDTVGKYVIDYVNETNGESFDYEINVYKRNYYFTGQNDVKSYAYYGYDDSEYNTGIKGLTVKLYSGEVFHYDEVIDISKCQENVHHAFMKWFAIPETMGHFDVERFHIRLTDLYDPSIYLDIYIFPYPQRLEPSEVPNVATENWKYFDTFITVGGENQIPIGLDWKADGTATIAKQNLSGFAGAHSMYGYSFRSCSVGKEILDLGLNLDTLEFESTFRIDGRSSVVCDLDDYSYQDVAWEGFTTGECTMSIEAYLYRDAEIPFTFMITDLAGNDLSVGEVIDETAPIISVEDTTRPIITNEYNAIPEFSAYDSLSEVISTNVSVYYNYGSNTEYEIEIKDGYFKPLKDGIYTIVYEAYDSYANKAIKKLRVEASSGSVLPLSLSFDEKEFTIKCNENVTLPAPTLSGDIKEVITTFRYNGKEESYSYTYSGTLYENEYQFSEAGTFEFEITVIDYYGYSKTDKVTYTITNDIKPFYEDEAILPMYIVEGGYYSIPKYYAIDYTNGVREELEAVCYIDLGGGLEYSTDRIIDASKVTDGTTNIIVKFYASNAFGSTSKTYEIPYISLKSNDSYHLENLLYGENISKKTTDDSIEIANVKSDIDTVFSVVNPLNVSNFNITFGINPLKCNFNTLKLTLTDSIDKDNKIEMYFTKDGTKSILEVGKERFECSLGFMNGTSISFEYNNDNRSIISGDFKFQIRKNSNGDLFYGFTSDKVYLTFEFLDVTGSSGIILNIINSQYLSNSDMDYTKPAAIVDGEYLSQYDLGETITLYEAIGIDVIDPNPSINLSVINLDGEPVLDNNGNALTNVSCDKERTLTFTRVGNYIIQYTVKDSSKKTQNVMFTFSVIDGKNPVINTNSKDITLNVNETLDVNSNATDENSLSVTFRKEVINPNGVISSLSASVEAICFTQKGEYTVRFTAIDETGNLVTKVYNVTVK